MKKTGFLRRVVLLLIFGWSFSFFVLEDPLLIQDPAQREWLRWFLYVAIGWGVVTLLADSVAPARKEDRDNE